MECMEAKEGAALAGNGSISKNTVECVAYFKSTKGFHRVMLRMKEKVKSLGAVGGTIVLNNPVLVEKEALEGLMRKDYSKNKSITVSLASFQESLKRTKFRDVELSEVLQVYFDDPLESTKSLAQAYSDKRDGFFFNFFEDYRDTRAGEWLERNYKSKKGVYATLVKRFDAEMQKYESEPELLKSELNYICRGLNSLPYTYGGNLRLPVFATEISKNPHFFDIGTFPGQMLVSGICHVFNEEKPSSAEQRAMLLYRAGILNDDVSNHVLCYGLEGGHSGWAGFVANGEPLVATLANLNRVSDIRTSNGKAYIFENPAVFSSVLDKLSDVDGNKIAIHASLICTYGQVKIAALVLMDMLANNGCKMYYSGDFDPEGLQIADRLKSRYGDKLIFWHYKVEDYLLAKSDNRIDPSRLKKLDSIKDQELVELANIIKAQGVAGYQERLIEELMGDVAEVPGII